MKNIIEELKKLDKILFFLFKKQQSVDEKLLKKMDLYSNDRLNFLEQEGLIFRTKIPTSYRLNQKGIVFIASGGYVSEAHRKNMDRKSNLFYLLSSPILAFISLLISLMALYFAISTKSEIKEMSFDFSRKYIFSISASNDTTYLYKQGLNNSKNHIKGSQTITRNIKNRADRSN